MIANKQDNLAEIMAAVQRKWGAQALRRGNEGATAASFSPLPTSFPKLDAILGGGILRGQITEFAGVYTSGVATLALKTVASAQALEERAIYLDPALALNPKYAFDLGVSLQELLIVRPATCAEGIEIAADLVSRYNAGLVVFGHMALRADDNSRAALRRLVNAVRRTSCAFVVLNRSASPLASPFHPYTTTQLRLQRARWLKRWGVIAGYLVRVTVVKDGGRDCNRSVILRFDLP